MEMFVLTVQWFKGEGGFVRTVLLPEMESQSARAGRMNVMNG